MSDPIVYIRGFDPFTFSLPLEDPIPAGKLTIALPEVNVKVGRMDLLDWVVGGPMNIASIELTLTEPMAASDLAAKLVGMSDVLKEAHAEVQRLLNANGPLFKDKVPASLQLAAMANYLGYEL